MKWTQADEINDEVAKPKVFAAAFPSLHWSLRSLSSQPMSPMPHAVLPPRVPHHWHLNRSELEDALSSRLQDNYGNEYTDLEIILSADSLRTLSIDDEWLLFRVRHRSYIVHLSTFALREIIRPMLLDDILAALKKGWHMSSVSTVMVSPFKEECASQFVGS